MLDKHMIKIFVIIYSQVNIKNEKGLMLLVKWFSEDLSKICSKWNQTIINISMVCYFCWCLFVCLLFIISFIVIKKIKFVQ